MRIGVDIRTLSFRKGGISQYTYHLLKNLIRIDSENRYFLFNFTKSPYEWYTFRENAEEIVLRLPQRHGLNTLWENLFVPAAVRRYGIDLWFSPDFFLPRTLRIPSIVTVHDLIYVRFHDIRTNRLSQRLFPKLARTVQEARKIIVTSNYTREDVIECLKVERDRIVVIPEAVDERFHSIHDSTLLSAVLGRYGITSQYILFVGELSERKNLIRLIGAYALLKKRNRIENTKLVLVGKRTVDTARILKEAKLHALLSDILFTGYVPDEDLPFFYNGSELFVFPSVYEGFGLPLLEAMNCHTPVAASNVTSIPEVVGDGALLFDPFSIGDIADKMDMILNRTIDVESLKARAAAWARGYSWTKTAELTLNVFQSVGLP